MVGQPMSYERKRAQCDADYYIALLIPGSVRIRNFTFHLQPSRVT